jgi:hypothetical protein
MISVDERRTRKLAAVEGNEVGKAEGSRQLSALMTDLNAYESDFDTGLDSLSGDEDDIKARKKANRSRRPVNERWREVLDEKSRKEGHTVYRMREPDEEVLEDAREAEKQTQAEWEAEWRARQDGTYTSRLDDADEDQPETTGLTLSAPDMPESDEAATAETADAPVEGDAEPAQGMGAAVSDWWNKMRGKDGAEDGAGDAGGEPAASDDTPVDAPVTDEAPMEMPASDEPASEEPVAEATPPEKESSAKAKASTGKKAKKSSAKSKTSGKSRKKS